ncbi:MAG: LysR family transcriptional regulator [Clostridiales bacterium]|nr:LysR family transcriptional regulator [Clostridiales bacterium]
MYDISFREIEFFLAVAEHRNYTEAASALYVSQPSVSKWIMHLEKEMGVMLFARDKRNVALTPAGKTLYLTWKPLYKELLAGIEGLRENECSPGNELKLGCLSGLAEDSLLHDIITNYEASAKRNVSLFLYDFKELNEKLINRELDAVISISQTMQNLPGISQQLLRICQMFFIIPRSHDISSKSQITFNDLRNETFLMLPPEEDAHMVQWVTNTCKEHGFMPKISYTPNLQSLKMAISQGKGITICNHDSLREKQDYFIRFPIEGAQLSTYTTLAWRTNDTRKHIARLVEISQQLVE